MKLELGKHGEIVMSAKDLSAFAENKIRRGSVTFSQAGPVSGYVHDLYPKLSHTTIRRGEVFVITAEPFAISTYVNGYDCACVSLRKPVKALTSALNPLTYPDFLAEAYVTAFLVCETRREDTVVLKLTFHNENNDEKNFDIRLERRFLERVADSLLERAAFFAIVKKRFEFEGKPELVKMPFPYLNVRDGQRDFIKSAYRAIAKGERLLVCAPTGIGKTVSALYPAVKAIGAGLIDKVFYLTAKTVTGIAAAKTAELFTDRVPEFRAVTVIAKERCCPSNDKKIDFTVDRCSFDCPRLADNESGSYKARRDAALTELLAVCKPYGKEDISAAAEKYGVCPYELSLDLSEYCQIVICDYNYATDPKVKFRRYFSEGDLKYAFLIDEAHNLPDRTRDTFSSALDEETFVRLFEALCSSPVQNADLAMKIKALVASLGTERESCLSEAEETGGEKVAFTVSNTPPKDLFKAVQEAQGELSKARNKPADEALTDLIDEAYAAVSDFAKSYEYFDQSFEYYTEAVGEKFTAKIMCLDPAFILDRVMSGAVSSILFSATLTPLDYFADVTGCASAAKIELESPYDPNSLCVTAVDTVSTKLLARDETATDLARMILAAVSAKEGHYIVYFPSYKYMETVFAAFCKIAPKGISALVQKQSMSLGARKKFLSFFEDETESGTLVGFCVLGGVFSEGIDLPDEKLIGAVLVGIGLPSLSSELNILKDYYDRTREDGFEFAYLYPAMIKISQAAGRVIRGEEDRGVVVLIDDRYKDPAIRELLPHHWKNVRIAGNERSLGKILTDFWNNKK